MMVHNYNKSVKARYTIEFYSNLSLESCDDQYGFAKFKVVVEKRICQENTDWTA